MKPGFLDTFLHGIITVPTSPQNFRTWCMIYDSCFSPEFPTTRMEMEAVVDIFDRDHDGYIDYKEFVQALRPDRSDVSNR